MGCAGLLSFALCANDHLPTVQGVQAVSHTQEAPVEDKEAVQNMASVVLQTEEEKATIAREAAKKKLEEVKAMWSGKIPTRSVDVTTSEKSEKNEKKIEMIVEDNEDSPIVRIWISGLNWLNKKDLHLLTGAKTTYQKGIVSLVTKKVYYQDN